MNKKLIISILVCLLMGTVLFASGAREQLADFKSLNLETESIENIQKTWDKAQALYADNVEKLQKAMAEAYEERNAKEYTETRELLRSLEAPVITPEMTETLQKRFDGASEKEKEELAAFLSQNSRFYHPTLYFSYEYSNGGFSSSFHKSISVAPGSTFTAPSMDMGEGKFLGWGTEEGEVLYEAGSEMVMPYADTTLYAVFTTGISFKNMMGEDVFVEGSSASVPAVEAPEGAVFCGWYDRQGNLLEEESVNAEEGKNASFTAAWKAMKIETADDADVPTGRILRLSFSLSNEGNLSVKDVSIVLSGSEGLEIRGADTLTSRRIASGSSVKGHYDIVFSGNTGDKVEALLTVTDGDGNTWSEPMTFTIQ